MTGACMPEVSSSCILRSVFLEPFVKVGVAKRCGGDLISCEFSGPIREMEENFDDFLRVRMTG